MAEILVAEFDSPERLVAAAARIRALGYTRVDSFTPFPIAALDEPLGLPRTKLRYAVLFAGILGALVAYVLQWWTNAIDYPINVGGRPPNSIPTHILIVFETTVLFAALTAFVAPLVASGLPRLHHPVFDLPGFERTTIDRFWLTIGDAYIARPGMVPLHDELARLGAVAVQDVTGDV